MIDKKPEVLAPAGDRERLEAALHFGADAVYLGGKLFNMRAGTRSFTQEELAEAVGVSRQAVSKWESGASDPSTANLIALAKLLGTTPEELLKESQ